MNTTNSYLNKFDGKDFGLWKFHILINLKASGLYRVFDETKKPSDTKELEKWLDDDIKAQQVLTLAIEYKQLRHIMRCDTASKMWQKLCNVFEKKSESTIGALHKKFFDYKMDGSDNMAGHIANLEEIVAQLETLGEPTSETTLVNKILSSLPDKYKYFNSVWD